MVKVALLSNINIDILKSCIEDKYKVYTPFGYGTWYQDAVFANSNFVEFSPDQILILLEGNVIVEQCMDMTSSSAALLEELEKIKSVLSKYPNTFTLVSTIDLRKRTIRPLDSPIFERELEWIWYNGLKAICNKNRNTFIFDLKGIVEEIGRDAFYNPKMWYSGGIPFSLHAHKRIAEEIYMFSRAYAGNRMKCLAVDLDNTIWGGVIGEDGAENIILGPSKEGALYRDIQKRIKELKNTGVVLTVLSKNNKDDALSAFRNNPFMVLKQEDFVAIIVDWNKKAFNIKSLASTLNIGIDSFVFLDDNPVEQEEMKVLEPEVKVVPIDPKVFYDEGTILKLYKEYFVALRVTNEDLTKTISYASDTKRLELKSQAASLEDYLRKLEIVVWIQLAVDADVERISQLTQKTNQFNLTTRRYTRDDINKMTVDSRYQIFVGRSRDKFSDNGIVWLTIVRMEQGVAYIDTALMSCRVMGRMIEYAAMSVIENQIFSMGIQFIEGEYIPTNKNAPVKDFFKKMGYESYKILYDGKVLYRKRLNGIIPSPDCLQVFVK